MNKAAIIAVVIVLVVGYGVAQVVPLQSVQQYLGNLVDLPSNGQAPANQLSTNQLSTTSSQASNQPSSVTTLSSCASSSGLISPIVPSSLLNSFVSNNAAAPPSSPAGETVCVMSYVSKVSGNSFSGFYSDETSTIMSAPIGEFGFASSLDKYGLLGVAEQTIFHWASQSTAAGVPIGQLFASQCVVGGTQGATGNFGSVTDVVLNNCIAVPNSTQQQYCTNLLGGVSLTELTYNNNNIYNMIISANVASSNHGITVYQIYVNPFTNPNPSSWGTISQIVAKGGQVSIQTSLDGMTYVPANIGFTLLPVSGLNMGSCIMGAGTPTAIQSTTTSVTAVPNGKAQVEVVGGITIYSQWFKTTYTNITAVCGGTSPNAIAVFNTGNANASVTAVTLIVGGGSTMYSLSDMCVIPPSQLSKPIFVNISLPNFAHLNVNATTGLPFQGFVTLSDGTKVSLSGTFQ